MSNIKFPFIVENLKAVVKHYYPVVNFELAGLNFILGYSNMITLDEFEKIIKVVKKNDDFFIKFVSGQASLANILKYGIDAYIIKHKRGVPVNYQNYTWPRKEITEKLKSFF